MLKLRSTLLITTCTLLTISGCRRSADTVPADRGGSATTVSPDDHGAAPNGSGNPGQGTVANPGSGAGSSEGAGTNGGGSGNSAGGANSGSNAGAGAGSGVGPYSASA